MTSSTTPPVGTDAQRLYGPVAGDLHLVSTQIQSIAQNVGFEFLQRMLETALAGSGKMMRPAIALLAGRLGTYDLDRLVPHPDSLTGSPDDIVHIDWSHAWRP